MIPSVLGRYPGAMEQASTLVTADVLPTGPDSQYADAGYDEVYVQQIGPRQEEFFEFWQREVAPNR